LKKNEIYIILIAAAFLYLLNRAKKTETKQTFLKETEEVQPQINGILDTTF
jgi:hypothetical protein